MTKTAMLKKIRKALFDFAMLGEDKRILVALSGGKDSVALLYALVCLRDELSLSLCACHVNHHIREDSETAEDIALCQRLCRQWDVPLTVKEVDIPLLSGGKNTEDCARIHRYRLLREAADFFGVSRIATAHTATDSAETMLFRLLRGSSGDGLCGIPPMRDGIIRPLILCSEADVLTFCKENTLPFRTDSTNADNTYSRNLLRNEVSPLLRQINPSFEDTFSSLAASLRRDREFFDNALPPFSEDVAVLSALSPAILSRVLKREYDSQFKGELSSLHIDEMMELVYREDNAPKRLSLPQKALFVREGNRAFFCPEEAFSTLTETPDPAFSLPLSPGEHPLPDGSRLFVCEDEDDARVKELKNIYKLFICQAVKRDAEVGRMFVRLRLDGDFYRFGGMTRSVKKALQAKSLPLSRRKRLPVVCDEDGIVWIPFLPARDGMQAEKSENRLNIFYFYG